MLPTNLKLEQQIAKATQSLLIESIRLSDNSIIIKIIATLLYLLKMGYMSFHNKVVESDSHIQINLDGILYISIPQDEPQLHSMNAIIHSLMNGAIPLGKIVDYVNIVSKAHEVDEIYVTAFDIAVSDYQFMIGGARWGEFTQPKELTELVLQIIEDHGCSSMYNPFAGMASYGQADYLEKYYAQEINDTICFLSKIRLLLNGKDVSGCIHEDSIMSWDAHNAECIVSTPPFGLRIRSQQIAYINTCAHTADEFLLERFVLGNAKCGVFVVPQGVCFRNQGFAFSIRKEICNRHMLEMVIKLPFGIFPSTNVSTSIIVLNRCQKKDDMVTLVNAEKSFLVGKKKGERKIDVPSILYAIKNEIEETSYRISYNELYENDCSFDVVRYVNQHLVAKKGQQIVTLGDVLIQDKGETHDYSEGNGALAVNYVDSKCFISDIVNQKNADKIEFVDKTVYSFEGPHLVFNRMGKIYLHKGEENFFVGRELRDLVFKVNESLVDIEYLAWNLLRNDGPFQKMFSGSYYSRISLKQLLNCKIIIDNKLTQRQIIDDIKRGEMERLGIREACGDLTHMLGMPKDKISNLIDLLMSSETMSDEDKENVKAIDDNFRYMLRIVNTVGVDFSTMLTVSHVFPFAGLIRDYAKSLRNFKFSNCYSIEEEIHLPDDITVNCDEDLIRVILDTAFRNAYTHGFGKRYSESNKVLLGCRAVEYDEVPYVCLTIANNGNPIETGFSVEDFATKGMKAGTMGNTGKGGYHIFSIAKKYKGYICITSSVEWSFILEVLLPAENINNIDTLESYGNKCI